MDRTCTRQPFPIFPLHYVLAESCLRSIQTPCALKESKRVLEIDSNSAEAHMLMGETLDGLNQTKEAVAEFIAAAQSNSELPYVHFGLGYLYWKQHDYGEAAPEFEAEIRNLPASAQSYAYLGDIAYRANQQETAFHYLKKAVALQPDIRLAHFDLGCVLEQQKKSDEAIAEFIEAKKLDPTQADAYYRLGRIYMAAGRKQQADLEFATTKKLHSKAAESLIQKVSGSPRHHSVKPS